MVREAKVVEVAEVVDVVWGTATARIVCLDTLDYRDGIDDLSSRLREPTPAD